MTLGERIAQARTGAGLSQSELAERLEVSRQSVSKWETDASVPELDKLTRLCDLFGLTMDQLVRGEEPQTQKKDEPQSEEKPTVHLAVEMRKLVGGVLLIMGGMLLALVCLITGDFPFALMMVLPLLGCGLLCLVLRSPGLWCAWFVWLLVVPFQHRFVRFSVLAALTPAYYQNGLWLDIIISLLELLLTAGLAVWTFIRLRSRQKR